MKDILKSLIGDYWKNIIILILLLVLLSSCGARKKETSKTNEVTNVENSIETVTTKKDTSNVKKTENTTIDDKTKTVSKQTVWEPVDPSKPASVIEPDGTKTDLNNSKKTVTETTKNNDVKTEKVIDSVDAKKSEQTEQTQNNSKSESKKEATVIDIDKKQWNPWNLTWGLIPIGILVFLWNKYIKK